ncbi:lanthionine synthetase C family protein, partial [Nocardiopsis dassonvillei]|uniref:lanthionine synthetase C family protein n=1 Tax=Nocardiopsis dassonvillei TaxID=2014 RepID=UPI0020109418
CDAGSPPTLTEFDAIRGLTGLGHLLMLRAPDSPELRDLVCYLVHLTEPRTLPDGRKVPGWWTHLDPGGDPSPEFPEGHANHGMAHGISGPLALLAHTSSAGIDIPGQPEAIGRILTWLDRWQHHDDTATWWPYWITATQHRGEEPVTGPQRPSWCYGAAGIARAQHLAAHALGDTARAAFAEQVLAEALTLPAAREMVVDDSLCHGWAGLALIAHASGIGDPHGLLAPILTSGDPEQIADRLLVPRGIRSGIGLLEGGSGIATALHTLATQDAGTWYSFLLIGEPHV